jgi:hypothetical protein
LGNHHVKAVGSEASGHFGREQPVCEASAAECDNVKAVVIANRSTSSRNQLDDGRVKPPRNVCRRDSTLDVPNRCGDDRPRINREHSTMAELDRIVAGGARPEGQRHERHCWLSIEARSGTDPEHRRHRIEQAPDARGRRRQGLALDDLEQCSGDASGLTTMSRIRPRMDGVRGCHPPRLAIRKLAPRHRHVIEVSDTL